MNLLRHSELIHYARSNMGQILAKPKRDSEFTVDVIEKTNRLAYANQGRRSSVSLP